MFWLILHFSDGTRVKYRIYDTREAAEAAGRERLAFDPLVSSFSVRKSRIPPVFVNPRQIDAFPEVPF